MLIRSSSRTEQNLKLGQAARTALGVLLFLAASTAVYSDEATIPSAEPAPPTRQANAPVSSVQAFPGGEAQGSAPLRVMVGKSLLINTPPLKRVSVTDPTVAEAIVLSPTQVLINGRSAGEVFLLTWDNLVRSRSFDLRAALDVTACAE